MVFSALPPEGKQAAKEVHVAIYKQVYDFAAKAGSLEGYVYPGGKPDPTYLPAWSDNLVQLYNSLPPDVRGEIQGACDETLGRTIQSLIPVLGKEHEVITKLRTLVRDRLPSSPDDFPHNRK